MSRRSKKTVPTQILETKRLDDSMTLTKWTRLLGRLATSDAARDQTVAHNRFWFVALLVALPSWLLYWSLAGLAVLRDLAKTAPHAAWAVGTLVAWTTLALVLLTFKTGRALKAARKIYLDNGFREIVLPFLRKMAKDVQPDARVPITIDMWPTHHPRKLIRTTNKPAGRLAFVKVTAYKNPWFRATLPLVTGDELRIDIEDTVLVEERGHPRQKGVVDVEQAFERVVVASLTLVPDRDRSTWAEDTVQQLADSGCFELLDEGGVRMGRLVRKISSENPHGVPPSTLTAEELLDMVSTLRGALVPQGADMRFVSVKPFWKAPVPTTPQALIAHGCALPPDVRIW